MIWLVDNGSLLKTVQTFIKSLKICFWHTPPVLILAIQKKQVSNDRKIYLNEDRPKRTSDSCVCLTASLKRFVTLTRSFNYSLILVLLKSDDPIHEPMGKVSDNK